VILPILQGLTKLTQAPVTWLLFTVNFVAFLYFSPIQQVEQENFEKFIGSKSLMTIQGELYRSFQNSKEKNSSNDERRLRKLALANDVQDLSRLGQLSFRDSEFNEYLRFQMNRTDFNQAILEQVGDSVSLLQDSVLLAKWKESYFEFSKRYESDPARSFGVTAENHSPLNLISYQFVHANFSHFLGNMYFLLVFGGLVEIFTGSALFLIGYLLTGVAAAIGFGFVGEMSSAPLVGASGAISGIMGMYCVLQWKKSAKFVYYLMPLKNYFGVIYLPVWICALYWVATDLVQFVSIHSEIGGVAHTAHLTGFFLGLILGLFLKFWERLFFRSEPAT
jgi:membrane associated rhomboid family serine protease